MRYVITGGTGHIGNNLVRLINEKETQAEIVTLLRRENPQELEGAKYTAAVGNLLDKNFLAENIQEGDVVVHLAGLIDLTNKKTEQTYKINVGMTKDLVAICKEKKVKKFVYVGSVDAIYREGDGEIIEPEKYFPDKIQGDYGKSKAEATQFVLDEIKKDDTFDCAIVLPTAVIGRHDYKPSAIGKVIKNTILGKAEFGIKGGYNFVDVEDVARAIYDLSKTKLRGQYIISGQDVSVEEMYNAINEYKGFKRKPIILPTWIAHVASPFVKVLNKITIKALGEPHNYSSAKAGRDLNYQAKTFNETIKGPGDFNFIIFCQKNKKNDAK